MWWQAFAQAAKDSRWLAVRILLLCALILGAKFAGYDVNAVTVGFVGAYVIRFLTND